MFDMSKALATAMDQDDGNVAHILDLLKGLREIPRAAITLDVIKQTKAGRRMKTLSKKHTSEQVRALASSIMRTWKEIAAAQGYKKGKPAATAAAATTAAATTAVPSAAEANTQQKSSAAAEIPADAAASVSTSAEASSSSSAASATSTASASAATSASSSSSSAESASSSSSTDDIFAKTENPKRRKIQQMFFKLFEHAPDTSESDWPTAVATAEVAVNVETCIDRQANFATRPQDYVKIVKRLRYNLRENTKLCVAAARSYLPPHALVIMEPAELATDEARDAKHEAMEYDKGARRSNWKQANAALMAKQAGGVLEDSMYRCPKCGSRKVTNFAMQTRSADEPMTVFCTCIKCSYAFRR